VWQAILPAGGLSGRLLDTNFSGFAVSMPQGTKPENYPPAGRVALDWTS